MRCQAIRARGLSDREDPGDPGGRGDGASSRRRRCLDDQKATLIVATGAEFSMVTPAAMFELQLPTDPRQRTTLTDIGGSVTKQNALVRSLKVGAVEMLDQSLAVGQLPAVSREKRFSPIAQAPEAGLLGADWLSGFDVELDLPHQRVRAVPGAWVRRRLCALAGTEDQPACRDLRTRAGSAERDGRRPPVQGQGGQRDDRLLHRGGFCGGGPVWGAVVPRWTPKAARWAGTGGSFTRICIASACCKSDRSTTRTRRWWSATCICGSPNLLLGLDWLRHNRVWISYADHRVTIQPESPPML